VAAKFVGNWGAFLEGDQAQAMDLLEMPTISGCHRVPSFKGTCPNQQIVEWNRHAKSGGLSADPANQLRCTIRDLDTPGPLL
jgi:hypothetical protein